MSQITREQAINIARGCAFARCDEHGYLPKSAEEAYSTWTPHEWVIDAIRAGAWATRPTAGKGEANKP